MNPNLLRMLLGLGVSAAALSILARGIDIPLLVTALSSMNPLYLMPAVISTFVSYYLRAVRWRLILEPVRVLPLSSLFGATIVGYMANNILPARLGELVRAHMLARREGITTSQVLATLVIDRLWDGFTVLLILVVTLVTMTLPAGMENVQRSMVRGGYLIAALYVLAIVVLVVMKRHEEWISRFVGRVGNRLPGRAGERCGALVESFVSGISAGSLSLMLRTFLVSCVVWGFALWPVDLILRSFGLVLPVPASMLILVFLVFAVMIPAAPGYLGTFHLACVYGLKAFRVENESAMSIAIVLHAINFLPVIVAGFLVLLTTRTSLSSLAGGGGTDSYREEPGR